MPRALNQSIRDSTIYLINNNHSNSDISQQLNIETATVQRWRAKYRSQGNLNNDYGNCGSECVLSDEDKLNILLKQIEDPFKPATEIKKELELNCTSKTINNFFKTEGINTYHAATKPKLLEFNSHGRVNFAIFHSDQDWSKCIFVDECCLSTEKNGFRMVKGRKGERYNIECLNQSDHSRRKVVSIFGSISYNGLGTPIFLDSRLDQSVYLEIISSHGTDFIKEKFGSSECYWIDDNCPAHRANVIRDWFDCCGALNQINCKLLRLAPYSPDLNVIENVWGKMKKDFLDNNLTLNTNEELKSAISSWWQTKKNA